MTKKTECPDVWDKNAHNIWLGGNYDAAIQLVLRKVNASQNKKPKLLIQQFGYYLFLR